MKKNFLILFIIVFTLNSCIKAINDKKDVSNISSGAIVSSWTTNNTGVLLWTWITNFSWTIDKVQEEKPLTLEEKISLIKTEKEVIEMINKNKIEEYTEELSRVDSYYSKDAFYEFYILNSIKNSDILECDKIIIEDKKNLCKELNSNYMDEDKVIEIYWRYWEEQEFSKIMYKLFVNLKLENKTCENENIISYLACKKMFDKNFDAKKMYLNYYRLVYSNAYDAKKYYDDISIKWKLDNWFKSLIDKTLINTDEKVVPNNDKAKTINNK